MAKEQGLPQAILIVEDEALIAWALQETLRAFGYSISGIVSSGEDALRHVREHVPDLVLMDVHLRGALDGVDAARMIRDLAGSPVVFLTSHSDSDTLRRATEAEPFGYLVKPFRDAELRCAIEVAIVKHRMEMRHRQDEQQLTRSLRVMASRDDLTGLHNRRGFSLLAEQELKRALRVGETRQVFFADLDDLKRINDTLGHAAGDRAIRDAAMILARAFRTADIVARIGGDEFVVLCTDGNSDHGAALRRLDALILEYNSTPNGAPFKLAISTGSATYDPGDDETLDNLLQRADQAMYQRKAQRKRPNRVVPGMGSGQSNPAASRRLPQC